MMYAGDSIALMKGRLKLYQFKYFEMDYEISILHYLYEDNWKMIRSDLVNESRFPGVILLVILDNAETTPFWINIWNIRQNISDIDETKFRAYIVIYFCSQRTRINMGISIQNSIECMTVSLVVYTHFQRFRVQRRWPSLHFLALDLSSTHVWCVTKGSWL